MAEGDDPNTLLLLGEIRGQMRELVHSSNNNAQKIDTMTNQVSTMNERVSRLEPLAAVCDGLANRVDALERTRDEQRGAAGVLGTILKSPAFGWLFGAAAVIWAFLTGRLTP